MLRSCRRVGPSIAPWLIAFLAPLLLVPVAGADLRLGSDVVPVFESVDLRLDAGTPGYTGSVHVDLEVKRETDVIRFHAQDMTLETLRLSRGKEAVDTTHEAGEEGTVAVHTGHPMAPGTYALDIAFSDDFNTDAVGLYRMEQDGVGYAFTQFEANDARRAFPCWDEPGFKIPYRITLTVPRDHLAVTNTPVESETDAGDGWKRVVFKKTKPLPSYLLAVATGPLESVDIPGLGVPGRVITVRGQSKLAALAVQIAPPLLHALEAWFRMPYPYEKLDLIAVPEFWPGAMENAGAITFADRILLLDPATASAAQKRTLIRVTAHEMSHMWFGDLVTMAWWDDLWLNESFADWMGDKIANQVYPENHQDLATVQAAQEIMFNDARPSSEPIRRRMASDDNPLQGVGLAYNKGKAVLGMIEAWAGPEAFRDGVINYLKAHVWGNAAAGDLWTQLDETSGKDVSGPLAGFIEQPGYPLIDVSILEGGRIRLDQHRFHNDGSDLPDLAWQVPVGLRYAVHGDVRTRTVLLTGPSQTVELDGAPDWIFPNLDARGYYRWTMPTTRLAELVRHAPESLSAKERIALVSNLGGLLNADALGGDDYLRILASFAGDREPAVATTVLDAWETVEPALVSDQDRDAFAVYVRRALAPALERYGLKPRPGEDEAISLFRPRLVDWLGDAGRDPQILDRARSRARSFLEDPGSVDPALAGVYLNLAAHDGDRDLLEAYEQHFESAQAPADRRRYLAALGSFRKPEMRAEVLRYALEGPLRPQEILGILRDMNETPAGRDQVYRWMTEHYDTILGRIPPMLAAFLTFSASGCSAERLADARMFFAVPEHQTPGTERALRQVGDQVQDCLGLREREAGSVARYLDGLSQAGPSGH